MSIKNLRRTFRIIVSSERTKTVSYYDVRKELLGFKDKAIKRKKAIGRLILNIDTIPIPDTIMFHNGIMAEGREDSDRARELVKDIMSMKKDESDDSFKTFMLLDRVLKSMTEVIDYSHALRRYVTEKDTDVGYDGDCNYTALQ